MTNSNKNKTVGATLRFFQGVILGASGILPGVSGGVLCVVFGFYKPLMEMLASPLKKIKEHWKLMLPVGIGALCGFLLIVNVIGEVLENYESFAVCAFLGLIVGTLPSLIRTAGAKKRTTSSYVAFFASFIILFSLLTYLKYVVKMSLAPTFILFLAAGIIFGISIVLPGLSAYTILEFFGVFTPILEGARTFDFSVLIPVGVGGAAALIMLSKLINVLYEKYFSVMSHIIIGIVLATTVPLIPLEFDGFFDFAIKAALAAIGMSVAFLFDNLEKRFGK